MSPPLNQTKLHTSSQSGLSIYLFGLDQGCIFMYHGIFAYTIPIILRDIFRSFDGLED